MGAAQLHTHTGELDGGFTQALRPAHHLVGKADGSDVKDLTQRCTGRAVLAEQLRLDAAELSRASLRVWSAVSRRWR